MDLIHFAKGCQAAALKSCNSIRQLSVLIFTDNYDNAETRCRDARDGRDNPDAKKSALDSGES